jgi:hypothetical protein
LWKLSYCNLIATLHLLAFISFELTSRLVRVLSCVRTKCHIKDTVRHRLIKVAINRTLFLTVTSRSRKTSRKQNKKKKWAQNYICEQRWTRTTTAPAPTAVPGSSHHLNHQPSLRRSAIRQAMTEPMRISSFSSTVLVRTNLFLSMHDEWKLSHLTRRCFFLMHNVIYRAVPVTCYHPR